MQRFYVYMHVNKKNNKAYVGITCRNNPEYRWRCGEGYATQQKFYRAIIKEGWENFEHIIIASDLTKEEAVQLERQLIKQYDTIFNGYNVDEGGNSDTQQKKSVYLLDNNKTILDEFSCVEEAEFKLNLKASSITGCCNNPERHLSLNGNYFCYKEDYDTFKIRSKKQHPNSKKIYQVNANRQIVNTFESIQQAARKTNLSASHITACCRGTRNSVGGYFWSYADQISSLKIVVSNTYKYHNKSLIIYQYSLNNDLINTFKSCQEASRATGCASSSIARCCNGTRRTAGGFKWSYTEIDKG